MYRFIDHSKIPNYNWGLTFDDNDCEVEVIRGAMFFCKSQKISLGKLKEYFTDHAITKLEGDGFVKINRDKKFIKDDI